MKLSYNFTEEGECRVYYSGENSKGQEVNYCLQEEGDEVKAYRCSDDDWLEPMYEVKPKFKGLFLRPGSSSYGRSVWAKWDKQEKLGTSYE